MQDWTLVSLRRLSVISNDDFFEEEGGGGGGGVDSGQALSPIYLHKG